jgi:hypothetical protein
MDAVLSRESPGTVHVAEKIESSEPGTTIAIRNDVSAEKTMPAPLWNGGELSAASQL